jgi:hypothetical protein
MGAVYFITGPVVNLRDVFTRKQYSETVFEPLTYCANTKGLIIYRYVFISNDEALV